MSSNDRYEKRSGVSTWPRFAVSLLDIDEILCSGGGGDSWLSQNPEHTRSIEFNSLCSIQTQAIFDNESANRNTRAKSQGEPFGAHWCLFLLLVSSLSPYFTLTVTAISLHGLNESPPQTKTSSTFGTLFTCTNPDFPLCIREKSHTETRVFL